MGRLEMGRLEMMMKKKKKKKKKKRIGCWKRERLKEGKIS
jgi:hypothetical protein